MELLPLPAAHRESSQESNFFAFRVGFTRLPPEIQIIRRDGEQRRVTSNIFILNIYLTDTDLTDLFYCYLYRILTPEHIFTT